MIFEAIWLVANSLFVTLRLTTATGSFPRPLSAEDELAALKRCAAGDTEARNLLIEHNLRLVAHIIKKYYAAQSDQDDLISIGTIGLIKAIASFDPKKGARLATYAARCIENEILMYFRSQKKQSCEISLSEPIDSDSDGNVLALMDVISYEDCVIDNVDRWEKGRRVRAFIAEKLDEREREIIVLRYGFGKSPPKTQREIAQRCGISRSYVSRIEKRALKKLEKAFAQKLY